MWSKVEDDLDVDASDKPAKKFAHTRDGVSDGRSSDD